MFKKFYILNVWIIVFLTTISLNAQTSISVKFEQAPLIEVLEWLEKEHGYVVAYSKEAIEGVYVNQNFDQNSIRSFISKVLNGTKLDFRLLEQKRILVGPTETLPPTQNTSQSFTIRGMITDNENQPLPFANILNSDTRTGTSTDANGQFELTIEANQLPVHLQISYLGLEAKQVIVTDPMETVQVNLQAGIYNIPEIKVIGKLLPIPGLDASFLNYNYSEQLKSFKSLPGGVDLIRNIQLLPGIKASNHLSSRLNVRGSNADENMMLLDGMLLYNVDHFYGFFSAIHPDIFDDIQIHKNFFP
ncbi:MAG: carboxypeptidase-like regulatory domain-containing protein, partial [Bacteroidota bacterium]